MSIVMFIQKQHVEILKHFRCVCILDMILCCFCCKYNLFDV